MSEAPDIYWYLPTHGDGPYLGTDERHRPATLGYLSEIARAADRFGFKGVLLPTGTRCEDAWIIAAALIPQTRDLRFLVALRPGSGTPALFARHGQELRVSPDEWRGAIADISITNSVADSKAIDARNGPFVVISASGMATGGRVIHHLKVFAPHHRNTVLFAGFQAAGTRGQAMVNGAETIRIHGLDVPVRAEVRTLDSLSAHADHGDLIRWAGALQRPPRHVFLTHGEPIAADLLRRGLKDSLGWEAHVAEHLQKVTL